MPKKNREKRASAYFYVGNMASLKFPFIKKKVSVKAGLSLRMQAIKDFEKKVYLCAK